MHPVHDADAILDVALITRKYLREWMTSLSGEEVTKRKTQELIAKLRGILPDLAEDCLQAACVQILAHNEGLFPEDVIAHHSPNGEKRDPLTGRKLKAMGVMAGWPDLDLRFKDRTGKVRNVLVELKTITGVLSREQRKVHASLLLLDQEVLVARGLAEFIRALIWLAYGNRAQDFIEYSLRNKR